MRAILLIFAYFLLAGLLGSLLAYPVSLALDKDFDRIVSRSILVSAVFLLVVWCKFNSPRCFCDTSNLVRTSQWIKKISIGLAIGVTMLIPLVFVQMLFGYRYIDPDISILLWVVLSTFLVALISGFTVAVIEEYLFRGIILELLEGSFPVLLAILSSSLLYSAVHFLEPSAYSTTESVHWYSGFSVLLDAIQNLSTIRLTPDAFVTLFLAGTFLCLLRIHTGDLFTCIGVHAGWITVTKVFKSVTDRNKSAQYMEWYASDYDHITSHFTSSLIIIAIIYLLYRMTKSKHQATPASSLH